MQLLKGHIFSFDRRDIDPMFTWLTWPFERSPNMWLLNIFDFTCYFPQLIHLAMPNLVCTVIGTHKRPYMQFSIYLILHVMYHNWSIWQCPTWFVQWLELIRGHICSFQRSDIDHMISWVTWQLRCHLICDFQIYFEFKFEFLKVIHFAGLYGDWTSYIFNVERKHIDPICPWVTWPFKGNLMSDF